jgi:hypothetical protein
MSIKSKLLSTLPALFTGDERQVLEDWINNLTFGSGDYAELKTSADPVTKACAIFMEEGNGEVSFGAMQRCREAGITPIDYEKACIRIGFGNVWAVLNKQPKEVRVDASLELAEYALLEAFMLGEH